MREIEGLLIRVKKKKHAKNRQTPWENLFASDQQNISNRDGHRGKTNVIIVSVSSVKIIRISYEYHWWSRVYSKKLNTGQETVYEVNAMEFL